MIVLAAAQKTIAERNALYAAQHERDLWLKANTAKRLRIKAKFPPLMNDKPIIADKTPSPVREGLTARGRLERAAPNERLAIVLGTREWRGSTVQQSRSTRGEIVYDLRHKSGATMRLLGGV